VGAGWQALIVASLAGLVGLAELLGRYRSDPQYSLTRSPASWLYVVLNAGAGVGALFLIRAFGWTFGHTGHVVLWQVLTAGFGAIAFFRSSLFVTKIGGSTVGVGPSLVLGSLLDACDRDVDRKSAEEMSKVMTQENLGDLDPNSVMYALPVLCLALMQNFPPGDQAQLFADLTNVRTNDTLSPQAKMRAVAVQLAKNLGVKLVCHVLINARQVFETPHAAPRVVAFPQAALVIEEAKKLGDQAAQSPTQEGDGGESGGESGGDSP
jgi:hypothetical protein